MRITVTLDDETHDLLVAWAKADRRSVASTAAMLIEFALIDDGRVLQTPDGLKEEGRRLASQRDNLIAAGVPASDLAVPLAPITVPEPKPSKSPPKKEQPVECDHSRTWRVINGGAVICDACGSIRR